MFPELLARDLGVLKNALSGFRHEKPNVNSAGELAGSPKIRETDSKILCTGVSPTRPTLAWTGEEEAEAIFYDRLDALERSSRSSPKSRREGPVPVTGSRFSCRPPMKRRISPEERRVTVTSLSSKTACRCSVVAPCEGPALLARREWAFEIRRPRTCLS